MEFNIEDDAYFTNHKYCKNNNTLALSKLYYWCPKTSLPNTTDKVMLCLVPLIASDGTTYGMCGFEISSLLFKLSYSPDVSIYSTVFSLLSKTENGLIDCSSSFMAAVFSISKNELTDDKLSYQVKQNTINKYISSSSEFKGLHKNVILYSDDSPYTDEEWIVCYDSHKRL